MTINQTIGEYKIASDDAPEGKLAIKHEPTGERFVINEGRLEEVTSLSTEEAVNGETITESLKHDYSARYPQTPRRPESNGIPRIRPVAGVVQPVIDNNSNSDTTGGTADPFIVYDRDRGKFDLFFEQFDNPAQDVGHATSDNGYDWSYNQIVVDNFSGLSPDFAYPFTFKWQNEWYMVPTWGNEGVFRILRATDYPTSWEIAELAIDPSYSLVDTTPIYYKGRWYAFVRDKTNSTLRLYYADEGVSFTGRTWTEHPNSPVQSGNQYSTPAGRPLVGDDEITLWTRKGTDYVSALRVTELTPSSCATEPFGDSSKSSARIVGRTDQVGDPRENGMHHVDIINCEATTQPLAVVDAIRSGVGNNWSIMLYTTGETIAPKHRGDLSSNQTITTAGTDGWQTISVDTGYDFGQRIAGSGIYIRQTGYYETNARVALTNVSTSGFTVNLRLRDTSNGTTIHEETHEVNQAVDQTVSLYHQHYFDGYGRVEFQIQQDSGGDVAIDQSRTHCYLEKRHG